MTNDLIIGAIQIVILIYSVVLHEVSHGLAARSMGDDTAERLGRLTLNPLSHLDPFGSVLLPLLTKLLGGFMFGYAKPVPYNPRNLNDHRWGPTKVALAGPAANVVIAVVFGIALRLFGAMVSPLTAQLAAYVVLINLSLAVFNLLPIPPLDGHWLLMAILPPGAYGLKVAMYRYQFFFLLLAIFVVLPALVPFMGFLFQLLTGVPLF